MVLESTYGIGLSRESQPMVCLESLWSWSRESTYGLSRESIYGLSSQPMVCLNNIWSV